LVVVVAVLVLLVPLLLGLAAARWWAARAVEPDLGLEPDDDTAYPDHRLPFGHRPPPGLSPLSPSERFLAAEATRGLRDLQMFLLDVA
jgi:hypothetical protein